eukprot:162809-Heterocapsa_arctica.AAC.1
MLCTAWTFQPSARGGHSKATAIGTCARRTSSSVLANCSIMRRLSPRSFCTRENASSDSLAFTCCHVHHAVH